MTAPLKGEWKVIEIDDAHRYTVWCLPEQTDPIVNDVEVFAMFRSAWIRTAINSRYPERDVKEWLSTFPKPIK